MLLLHYKRLLIGSCHAFDILKTVHLFTFPVVPLLYMYIYTHILEPDLSSLSTRMHDTS